MEIWSLLPEDITKFEDQFHKLGPVNGNVTGGTAKDFFILSGLPANILAFIWELSDVTRDGQLNLNEFLVACKLIQMKIKGYNIPPSLPPVLLEMVTKKDVTPPPIVSSVNPVTSALPPPEVQSQVSVTYPVLPPAVSHLPTVPAVNVSPLTQTMPPYVIGSTPPLVPTPPSITPSPIISPTTAITSPHVSNPSSDIGLPAGTPPSYEWSVPYSTKLKYTQVFNQADKGRTGFLPGNQARTILVLTQLPIETLAKVWELADIDKDGQLSSEEFVLAMHLCDLAKSGKELKSPLPADLLPPTFVKKTRQNSLSSVGSNDGISAPTTVPVQAAFEDKRKENYMAGQAELEKRRKALLEIQQQEREAREKLEREENERKEKIRLEQERKRQEEMEKQLQKQREIEREKELERQKMLEEKENARREMERQRHKEWENNRIQELEARLQKELSGIVMLREKNDVFNNEYQQLCDKVRDLTQQAGQTRNGVNGVKSTIDGMRTTRDTFLSDITNMKAQLKEQNQRLITLNKEKAILEAKKQIIPTGNTEEQFNKDIQDEKNTLVQLREEVTKIKDELEKQKLDHNNNIIELKSLKENTSTAINNCEIIYAEYLIKQQQVRELKTQKLSDVSSSWGASAWDDASADAWVDPDAEPAQSVVTTNLETPKKRVRAMYEFVKRSDDELSFQPGDVITITEAQNTEPGWFAGELMGKTGWFPESYVENIDDNSISPSAAARDALLASSVSLDPALDRIDEVPENVSESGATTTAEFSTAPPVDDDTPVLDDGIIVNLAVQVLYQFDVKNENQLALSKGDIIRVSRKCRNWFYGEHHGYSGWFPESYVKEITTVENNNTPTVTDFDEYCTAVYSYSAKEVDDLTLEVGDIIKIIKKDGDWWTGMLNGKCGVFPSNYVEKADYQPTFSPLSESNQVPRCVSAPPTNFENPASSVSINRSMTPDFSSMSETESGKKKPEIATVIAPYEATSKEQLSLHRGQLIMIRKKTPSGWWEGESHVKGKKRQIGWFPASYVKVVGGGNVTSPIASELTRKQSFPGPNNNNLCNTNTNNTSTVVGSMEKVIALYKYTALNADELSFEKGDVIKMIAKEEPAWWKGELNGTVGLFPKPF